MPRTCECGMVKSWSWLADSWIALVRYTATRIYGGLASDCCSVLPGAFASEGKKEELFYIVSPLFIDTSLLVLVTGVKTREHYLPFLDMFTSCVVRCLV